MAGIRSKIMGKMDSKRIRQIVAALLILVGLAAVWPDRQFGDGENTSAPVAPAAAPAGANGAAAGEGDDLTSARDRPTAGADAAFDYYVLVLSWSPTYCSSDAGRGREDDMQCRSGRPYGFILHGLWPQYERGYPQNCRTGGDRSLPSAVVDRALKLTPSRDLIAHEWSKHGTCSGLSADDYFSAAASAVVSLKVPDAFIAPQQPIATTPDDVRQAFLDANRSISNNGLSATCSRNELAEVWVCLDKDLRPRACSPDVRKRHCGRRDVRMRAVRGEWPR
jgi:ribonuclease T2